MAWAPSPRLFAGRGAVRGLGEWPRPYAVAGVFDPERKNSRDRPCSRNDMGSAPYSPIGVRGCDRTEVCIMLTRRFLLLGRGDRRGGGRFAVAEWRHRGRRDLRGHAHR